MSSGVQVSDECLNAFQDLKLGKKYKYIILRISDDKKSIILEKTSTSEEYEQFLSDLPAGEPRWAVYDFQFEKEGAGRRNKILFYAWAPDEAPIKSKMLYSSSKDALRAKLVGIAFDIQCTDESERAYDTVFEKVSKTA